MSKGNMDVKVKEARFAHPREAGMNVPLLTNNQLLKSTRALNRAYSLDQFKKDTKAADAK